MLRAMGDSIEQVPLNLVTGFLGAGKTTLIRHLLQTVPRRWGVLVNEFGEIGIDGALLAGTGAQVREVPGGCLCCANGVPMRVALMELLRQARPEHVLIEPTGLGHPLQLLAQLEAPEWRGVLVPGATLCLIDPLMARRVEVQASEVFRQQLAAADAFVVNHADRAAPGDLEALQGLLAREGLADLPRVSAVRGAIAASLLDTPRRARGWQLLPAPPRDSGFRHQGAVWPAGAVFRHDDVLSLLLALPLERLKAVLHTDRGWLQLNATAAVSDWQDAPPGTDSRVEVIVAADSDMPDLQTLLDHFVVPPAPPGNP
jgi:hypothetical protein